MLSSNQKRNIKNRAYRARKEFKECINNLPRELFDLIMEYKPVPEEVIADCRRIFLSNKMKEIQMLLKGADTKNIYNLCTIGPLSSKAKEHPTISYYMRYYPYNKYDSFVYIPDDYDYWKRHMATYYKYFSNNKRIHREFCKVILDFIQKEIDEKVEFGDIRKQLLAIQSSI